MVKTEERPAGGWNDSTRPRFGSAGGDENLSPPVGVRLPKDCRAVLERRALKKGTSKAEEAREILIKDLTPDL